MIAWYQHLDVGVEKALTYLPPGRSEEKLIDTVAESSATLREQWRDLIIEPEYLFSFWHTEEIARSIGEAPQNCTYRYAIGESSADMACRVLRDLLEASEPIIRSQIGLIIHHFSTLDEHPSWSSSCRLQHESRLMWASAYCISQKSGASGLMALRIACETLAAEQSAALGLVVGSEKFVFPYRRHFDGMAAFSDGATALLVKSGRPALRLISAAFRDSAHKGLLFEDQKSTTYFLEQGAILLGELVADLLAKMKISPKQVAIALPPNYSLALAFAVASRAGFEAEQMFISNVSCFGSLLSCDFSANLSSALQMRRLKPGELVIALALGLDLSIICAMFEATERIDVL